MVHAIYDHQTVEHARDAAIKWQDRLILSMRQLIMLDVNICDRTLEMTRNFTDAQSRNVNPEYAAIYRREVKRAINEVERAVRLFKSGVLQGIDDEWRADYKTSQEAFDTTVMAKNTIILWYSMRNAIFKAKFEMAEPLMEIYYCMGLLDIMQINTEWRKEELHKLDASFDMSFKWEVFDASTVRHRMKVLMHLLTREGCKDRTLPLYPDDFPYNFMDMQESTKTACNIILQHANDLDRIVTCLVPEELAAHRAMLEEMEDWFDEHNLPLTMENADGWKRESTLCLEAQVVRRVTEDFETLRRRAADARSIFDAVQTWQELAGKAEAEWKRREKHNRDCDAEWVEALRRLHDDWTEERIQKEAEADKHSAVAIVTEPRIDILRERLMAAAPKEVQKALKPKRRRSKNPVREPDDK
ncbi:MAG: hypothetical protein IJ767_04335 [Bacteroidaceae bacterium]|nr:hypothetical protein [Bacteroidaceae bacterium]